MALRQGFLQGLQFPYEYHSPLLNAHLGLRSFLNQKDERATYGEFKNLSCLGIRGAVGWKTLFRRGNKCGEIFLNIPMTLNSETCKEPYFTSCQ